MLEAAQIQVFLCSCHPQFFTTLELNPREQVFSSHLYKWRTWGRVKWNRFNLTTKTLMAEPRFEFSRKQLKCQQGILITCTETAKLLTKTRPHFNNCHRPGVGLLVSDAISSRSASEIPFSLFSFFYSLGPSGSTVCAHCTTPSCIPKNQRILQKRQGGSPINQIYENFWEENGYS